MTARVRSLCFLPVLVMLLGLMGLSAAVAASPVDTPAGQSPDWLPECYSTNNQIQTSLQQTAASYPQIATLTDAGLSWEGTRHLWLLKLTNNARPEPKPAIYLVAAQRPRDIATAEMLLRYANYLTRNYGADSDVTWLLDNRSVYIMPMANPDGYNQVYSNGLNWPKNTDNSNGCSDPRNWGTDLNRNYPFHWNERGTSGDPCDSSYPGPSALSEPESQHILSSFVGSSTGLLVNLQAPGPAILYPWGYSAAAAPDMAGFDALGWNLARLNGTPRSSVSSEYSYLAARAQAISGDLTDAAYGLYGVPSLSLSIGATLNPDCGNLNALWEAQRPALLYATKAVGTTTSNTLSHAFGPAVSALRAVYSQGNLQVTGVLSANYGMVAGAVYAIDAPGDDGSGTPMSGDFGGGTANVSANIDTSGLANGRHLLLTQGVNSTGQWGVFSSLFFTVTGNVATSTPLVSPTPLPATPTRTSTATGTPSATPTQTATPTSSPISTSTAAATTTALSETNTVTPTRTQTGTATNTPLPTSTRTTTPSRTPTFTRTPSATRTQTSTRTPTFTRTTTPSRTPTFTRTPSATRTQTSTRTPSSTRTLTPTPAPSYTRTPILTGTPVSTDTQTPTRTPTFTRTSTLTRTPTPTYTSTPTGTPSFTRTSTSTPTPVLPRTATPMPCEAYSDVSSGQYFYQAVDWLTCRGIVSGYADGTFRPFNPATRAQIVKMVVVGEGWTLIEPEEPTFSDTQPADWFYSVVETAVAHHIVGGYADGTFHPNSQVTRGQLSKIIVLARGWPLLEPETPHFSDVPGGSTFYTYIETAQAHAVVSGYGDGTFRPNANATRGQLSKMLYIALSPGRKQ